jgi:hypothetical protein
MLSIVLYVGMGYRLFMYVFRYIFCMWDIVLRCEVINYLINWLGNYWVTKVIRIEDGCFAII